jgi:hypothetical protein
MRVSRVPVVASIAATFFLPMLAFAAGSAANSAVDFNRDIRPIMSDTCFRCHGHDPSSRMANMRLDLRDEATKPLKNGKIPIVPAHPEQSEIIQRIFDKNGHQMPPDFAHKPLTEGQKDTFRRWVAEGAKYEAPWAYQSIRRPETPKISGAENPIDAFVLARLERNGLTMSPEAAPRTLVRRISLDLTGLPPTPEETEAFIKDKSPDAYAKLVDRLMASPHYAEKQALYWLDAIRYSDSAGFHGDNLWPAWPYRDWVLRAFRDNMSFDEFTRDQIAGDLIPNATRDQKIASAYNRLNRYSAEGGIQPKEYLAKYGADRVRTLSTAWLGSTMGCSECHDHKFDPFTSKDFYAMKAFFADIKETGLMPDRGENAWGSKLLLGTPEQQKELDALKSDATIAKAALEAAAQKLMASDPGWEKRAVEQRESGALAWKYQLPLTATASSGATMKIYTSDLLDRTYYAGGSTKHDRKPGGNLVVASGPIPDHDVYTVTIRPGAGKWTALGIDIQQDDSLPGARLARGADGFVLSEVEASIGKEKLPFILATTTKFGEHPDGPAMAAIDGNPKTGWAEGLGDGHNAMIALRFEKPLATDGNSAITIRLWQEAEKRRAVIGRFRVALSASQFAMPESGDGKQQIEVVKDADPVCPLNFAVDRGIPKDVLDAFKVEPAKRNDKQNKAVLDFFEVYRPELQEPLVAYERADVKRALLEWSIPHVVTTEATEPSITRILPRANWMDETSEIVQPAIPEFLGKLDTGGRRATRLDLANWLVSPSNPLTARAYVNREWKEFFGAGISKTLDDLGSQGEWPTNPELLDWLAAEFMHPEYDADSKEAPRDWDMKHIVRTIVMSRAYRQSSATTPELDQKDPENRLIARQSSIRVDAEIVHDIALDLSGLLTDKFGGPPVKPYEPASYLAAMNFPKRDYSPSRGADLYRRGIYTEWQRTFLHPALLNFDAPTREECTVNRVISNTPLQALDLLNDPIFVEAARSFAHRIEKSGGHSLDRQIDWAFLEAENRLPKPEERTILEGLYRDSLAQFRTDKKDAVELTSVGESAKPKVSNEANLAAMTMVARAILNLHETITRN